MNRFFLALAISSALIAPAFADTMAADVACSTFMAMGHDDQMAAMTAAMSSDTMAADGTVATDGAMATDGTATANGAMSADDRMAAMVNACTAHPDMMATDAMHMME